MRHAVCGVLLLLGMSIGAVDAQSLTQVTGFGSNPGALTMYKYVPSGLPANAPLVVALHGCAQSASNYDAETGWILLADRWKFALLLPEQTTGNNSSRCFNWFEVGDIARGSGEALSIKQMVDRMKTDHFSDPARVFVTGLSAGGAFTSVMLATYPDVFAGGAIVAGVPYNCGTGVTNAFSCMNPGSDLSPAAWGNKVRAASSHGGPWPRVSIWHGDADTTVRPANANESMEQWTNVHGIDQTPDVNDTIGGFPHKVWRNSAGADLMPSSRIPSAVQLLRKGFSLHSNDGVRASLESLVGPHRRFDELQVPFQCVAAEVEAAVEKWFDEGEVIEAILASAALPAVYPPVVIDGVRYVDGGVIDNVPIARAVELGCRTIYVLHVGPHGRPDAEIRRPLDGALLAYWIARNSRFARDLASLPPRVEAIVLPPGRRPDIKYDDFSQTTELVSQGYRNSVAFLDERAAQLADRRRGADLLRPIERLVLSARTRSVRQAQEAATSPDGAIVSGDDEDEPDDPATPQDPTIG